mmetsp:Transcript_29788/g.40397  ORF Transcript_29788/g.40397 Transcript_29788/m.40397 type:complete len:92 (-) Transcript_29788:487-762(-)
MACSSSIISTAFVSEPVPPSRDRRRVERAVSDDAAMCFDWSTGFRKNFQVNLAEKMHVRITSSGAATTYMPWGSFICGKNYNIGCILTSSS